MNIHVATNLTVGIFRESVNHLFLKTLRHILKIFKNYWRVITLYFD